MQDSRELPGGARQSEADSELAFEQLTEIVYKVGSDGSPAVERGQAC